MKALKYILLALVLLVNLAIAPPSLADKPKYTKNPDYIDLTQALNSLKADGETASSPEVQNKIDELEFQKYTLESGINWGQCRNETGKTLAVYGSKPDVKGYPYETGIYFLADGKTTKNKWDCQGIYLPSDIKAVGLMPDGQNQELAGAVAIKIPDGSKLVVKTNTDTGAVEFNMPGTKVLKADEANWFVPKVSQEVLDRRVTNAPSN
ncbi:MAG TPA: hypothetical protein DDW76_17370 [Cyanobacteria bacterium UBA11369]|nr:hypothetical protein [Cyanobacteria bacterium UBA11371]HBE33004.1 hypothetical protein [Cyanobacteria bacterium UBA11368]HBE50514.1 hypothetical protein [Cyanobacteria bacterium UBA11369]